MMVVAERHERSGMPLWAVLAALLSATLSCLVFLGTVFLVFAWELCWVDNCLRWLSFVALAAVPLWLVLGLLYRPTERLRLT
jgi:hypothetical protein